MITVSLLGGDQYLAPEIVSVIQMKLADLYESEPEEVIFYAPDSFLIFNGVEQTSYQLNVVVEAPKSSAAMEKVVAQYLLKSLQDYAIHIHILFRYFEPKREYTFINPDYPRFMTATNSLKYDVDDMPTSEEEVETEEPFLGNAFKNVEDKFGGSAEVCSDECDCEDGLMDDCSADCHCHKHQK